MLSLFLIKKPVNEKKMFDAMIHVDLPSPAKNNVTHITLLNLCSKKIRKPVLHIGEASEFMG